MSNPIPEKMLSVRQHTLGGELVVEEIPVPVPRHGEVLIKIDSAPINPSDLSFINGRYGNPDTFPVTPGIEGSGEVIASGSGLIPKMRKGKRVSCSSNPGGNGTWAQYMITSALRCIPLPDSITSEQGSMMLVNPMTAVIFMDIAKKGNHKAIVNTAAASNLGKMLINLCHQNQTEIINIVRRPEQTDALNSIGAKNIIVSSSEDFTEKISRITAELNATLIFDAVAGREGSELIKASPRGSRIILYAKLSGNSIEIDSRELLREEKTIEGFQLGNWLASQGSMKKLRILNSVKKNYSRVFSSKINTEFPLHEINKAIELYTGDMSSGKVLLKPWH